MGQAMSKASAPVTTSAPDERRKYEMGGVYVLYFDNRKTKVYQAQFRYKGQRFAFCGENREKVEDWLLARTVEVKNGLQLTEVNGKRPTYGHISYQQRVTKAGTYSYAQALIRFDGKTYTKGKKLSPETLLELQKFLNEKILLQMSKYI